VSVDSLIDVFQRVISLNKLLGYSYSEDALTQALQNLSSSESLDFRAFLLPDSASSCDGSLVSVEATTEISTSGAIKNRVNKSNGDVENQVVVSVEQLLTELQSVCVEWKSLRRATNCSCAIPFEQHSKKVSMPGAAVYYIHERCT
jgi:hypothetical protein